MMLRSSGLRFLYIDSLSALGPEGVLFSLRTASRSEKSAVAMRATVVMILRAFFCSMGFLIFRHKLVKIIIFEASKSVQAYL